MRLTVFIYVLLIISHIKSTAICNDQNVKEAGLTNPDWIFYTTLRIVLFKSSTKKIKPPPHFFMSHTWNTKNGLLPQDGLEKPHN